MANFHYLVPSPPKTLLGILSHVFGVEEISAEFSLRVQAASVYDFIVMELVVHALTL